MNFFNELKRRNVFRVGAAYLVVAWLVLQIINNVAGPLNFPAWVPAFFIVLLGLGFPIALVLAWAFELTPEGIKPTAEVNAAASITPQTGQKLNQMIISGLLLILLLVVLDAYVLDGRDAAEPAATAVATPPAEPEPDINSNGNSNTNEIASIPEKSIAVLPFVDLSENKDQEYFTDGLSEELLNRLARVQDLQVAARTSSFYFKGRNEDMRTIGEQLGVAYILEGSVRKAGSSLRVTAQLIKANDGFHVFSETYDRNLEAVFAIQDEIAEAVTTALSISLSAGEFNREGMTSNVQAYEAYLRGSVPGNEAAVVLQSIENLKEAVALDPDFGLAWNALYRKYEISMITLPAAVSADFNEALQEALQQAGALIPQSPEYLVSSAIAQRRQTNWQAGETLFRTALDESGNSNVDANLNYGELLWSVGRVQDALPYLERARRLDPKQEEIATRLVTVLLALGREDAARTEVARGKALNPQNEFLGFVEEMTLMRAGEFQQVTDGMRDLNRPPELIALLQAIQTRQEDPAAVTAALQNLKTMVQGTELAPAINTGLGTYVAVAGDPEYALTFFSAATNSNISDIFGALMIWQPFMSDMRKLPGFKDLVSMSGLEAYWRSTGQWGDFCRPVNDDFECF